MSQVRRYYWDSGVFCSYFNKEKEQSRHSIVADLLKDADAGRSEILTSSFTLVEVLKIKGGGSISSKQEAELQDFFEYPFIRIVNADRAVCERARFFVWRHGLKPKDAVHMATAEFVTKMVPVYELFSWDTDFTSLDGKIEGIPFRLMAPYVKEPELPFEGTADETAADS